MEASTITAESPIARDAPPLDFPALVASQQAALLRLAQRFVREPEDAHDLVQATFADALERLQHLRDGQSAAGWLRAILVSRALNVLRRRRIWRRVRDALALGAQGAAPTPSPELSLARDARWVALARALELLPARQSAAFTLRYLEGLSVAEVAAALGVGEGTAKTHLHRALTALRGKLVEAEEEVQAP